MLPRRLRLALPLLLFSLCLTACGPTQTVLAPRLNVDPSLLSCREQPDPPAILRTDADLTDWFLDALDAGADCRSKVNALKGVVGG
jgi:hypothetical protein